MPDERNAQRLLQAVKRAAELERAGDGLNGRSPAAGGREPPHAQGIDVAGHFRPSPAAVDRFRGQLFDHDPVPVRGRFSATITGAVGAANRLNNVGLALWVDPDRTLETGRAPGSGRQAPGSLVAVNLGLFPTADPFRFPAFLQAAHQAGLAASGASDAVSVFAATDPGALSGILLYGRARQRGLPTSYAEATYHGNHGFWFACRRGGEQLARYRWEPFAGDRTRRDPAAGDRAPGDWSANSAVLSGDLAEQLGRFGAVRFTLVLDLGGPSQLAADPSRTWPETLERVVAGELELDTWLGERFEAERTTPWHPPRGISPDPADRVMQARREVYPLAGRG